MRVALYHNLPPGGALRVVQDFLRLRPNDLDIDVYQLETSGFQRRPSVPDVSAFHVEPVIAPRILGTNIARAAATWTIRSAERRVAGLINGGGYDVAYVHPCWFSQTPSLLRDLHIPTVYFMQEVRRKTFEPEYRSRTHETGLKRFPKVVGEALVDKVLEHRDIRSASFPDRILANSRFSAESIRDAYGRDATVVYLGVDVETFSPAAVTQQDLSVLVVGGLEPFKGQHLAVEALALLPLEERPELRLVYERFDPAYRQLVLRQAEQSSVKVSEYRSVSDSQLAGLYRSAAATMLLATREPFGLTSIESQACGTPVVAIAEGGYLETVTPQMSGVLVKRSPQSLAHALTRVLRGEICQDRRAIRQHVVAEWSVLASVERQANVLRELGSP